MPRRKIPKGYKPTKSKFFSMEANPKGASIGNFANNMKALGSTVKKVGTVLTTPVNRRTLRRRPTNRLSQ